MFLTCGLAISQFASFKYVTSPLFHGAFHDILFQAPQKAITAGSSTSSSTFLVGSADGRVLSYDTDSSSPSDAVQLVGGTLHTSLVSSMATASSGKVFTTGYDDHIREIEGSAYTSVISLSMSLCIEVGIALLPVLYYRSPSL